MVVKHAVFYGSLYCDNMTSAWKLISQQNNNVQDVYGRWIHHDHNMGQIQKCCFAWRDGIDTNLCSVFRVKQIKIILSLTTYSTHPSNSKYTLRKIKSFIFIKTQQVEIAVTGRNDKSNIFRTLGFPVLFYQSYRNSQSKKHFFNHLYYFSQICHTFKLENNCWFDFNNEINN